MKKLKVAFFGTPKFSINVLKTLISNESIVVTHVITGIDKKSGRGQQLHPTPVADLPLRTLWPPLKQTI